MATPPINRKLNSSPQTLAATGRVPPLDPLAKTVTPIKINNANAMLSTYENAVPLSDKTS